MNTIYLEHINLTVSNLASGIHFFQTVFPHFKIRGEGESNGKKWVHFGDSTTYIAIYEALKKGSVDKDMGSIGINHAGFVVSDVKAIAERLLKAGYKRDYPKQVEEFRIRDYFIDADGNEFEFVEYLSDIEEERNRY